MSERARLETTEAAVASGKNSSGDDGVYNQQTGLTTSTRQQVSIKHVSAGRLPLFFCKQSEIKQVNVLSCAPRQWLSGNLRCCGANLFANLLLALGKRIIVSL